MKKHIIIIISIVLVIAAILSFLSFDTNDRDNDKKSDSSSSDSNSTDSSDENISSGELPVISIIEGTNSSNDDSNTQLADAIQRTTFSSDTSKNIASDGTYIYFDSLTLQGELYPEKITFVNNTDNTKTAEAIPYLMVTPNKRFSDAEALADLLYLFSKSTNVVGNYASEITDQTLKEFKLDTPDIITTLTINGESKTFKISKISNEYCAVIYDGATAIRKVDNSAFNFLNYNIEDYYYKCAFMYSILDISNLTFQNNKGALSFDVDNHNETADTYNPYIVTINGKDVTENFKKYYIDFVVTQYSSFSITETNNTPDGTITYTFNNGDKTVITLFKVTETEYQCKINGISMGCITATDYNKIFNNFTTIANGESVK